MYIIFLEASPGGYEHGVLHDLVHDGDLFVPILYFHEMIPCLLWLMKVDSPGGYKHRVLHDLVHDRVQKVLGDILQHLPNRRREHSIAIQTGLSYASLYVCIYIVIFTYVDRS